MDRSAHAIVVAAKPRRYVAYYRVSTSFQERSGLGLEAQKLRVREFAEQERGEIIAEFTDIASGRKENRPRLKSALNLCRFSRSTLVIARLDRLARSLKLISALLENKTEFIALDCPHANKFTIHVLSALAEYESRLLAERVSQARASAKREGRPRRQSPSKKGKPVSIQAHEARTLAFKMRREQRAKDLKPIIWPMIEAGLSYKEISKKLTLLGIPTGWNSPNGWYPTLVLKIVKAINAIRKSENPAADLRISATQRRIERVVELSRDTIMTFRGEGKTCAEILDELIKRNIPAPHGKRWTKNNVYIYTLRVLDREYLREKRCVQ